VSMDSGIRYDDDELEFCNCGHSKGSHVDLKKCLGCEDDWDDSGDPFVSDNINPYHHFEESDQSVYERMVLEGVKL
jgi:hypothetical protein